MKIHILSDLHTEFEDFEVPYVDADVTVLAGDIATKGQAVQWAIDNIEGRVVVVAGNHDYYNADHRLALGRMREEAATTDGRVSFLERDAVEIDGVQFLGATGWTDFEAFARQGFDSGTAMPIIEHQIRDFHLIFDIKGADAPLRAISASTMRQWARETRQWLGQMAATPFAGKRVLITHFPITLAGRNRNYPTSWISPYFANAWDELTAANEQGRMPFDLIVHGHTHGNLDCRLGSTRIVSNQRGYPNEPGMNDFDAQFVVEI